MKSNIASLLHIIIRRSTIFFIFVDLLGCFNICDEIFWAWEFAQAQNLSLPYTLIFRLEWLVFVIVVGCKLPENVELFDCEEFYIAITAVQLLGNDVTKESRKQQIIPLD